MRKNNKQHIRNVYNHELLQGMLGIGVVLLSYITEDFSWNYCLMLND